MTSLIQLLVGRSVAQFRADHWPYRPLYCDGPLERLSELTSAPALRGIAPLLRAHTGPVWLHRRAGGRYDRETSAHAGAAPALFSAGEMLDLRDLQRSIPLVQTWLSQLQQELSVEAGSSYCHAFVSPAGTGVPKHFDNCEVIVVQLVGRKRWQLARPALAMPLKPHVAGVPAHPFNRHAGDLIDAPEMPADAAEHVLAPGAVLFVPRGHWHATHALEDSLSLSFGIRAPSWAEVFVNTALQELAGDPAWRAAAFDIAQRRPPGTEAFLRGIARAIDELRATPPPASDEEP